MFAAGNGVALSIPYKSHIHCLLLIFCVCNRKHELRAALTETVFPVSQALIKTGSSARLKTALPDILSLFHVGAHLNLDISLSIHINHTCVIAVLHLVSVVKNSNICLSDAGELLDYYQLGYCNSLSSD